ncbi:MAG: pseudouridine synthase [Verrucomicrobiales bacterium]
MSTKTQRRIDQWLTNLGYCSRREARYWARAGRLSTPDGVIKDVSQRVAGSELLVDGEPLDHPDGLLILMHKPLGLVCSHTSQEGSTVYDLLPDRWRSRNPAVNTVGRLDKDTTGVLLFTDLPGLIQQLTSPRSKVSKVYQAQLDKPADLPRLTEAFTSGELLLEGESKPCAPAQIRSLPERDPSWLEVTIMEGRYHQVRRMFGAFEYEVITLHRQAFGPWTVAHLDQSSYEVLPPDFDLAFAR